MFFVRVGFVPACYVPQGGGLAACVAENVQGTASRAGSIGGLTLTAV